MFQKSNFKEMTIVDVYSQYSAPEQETIHSDCVVHCDKSSANLALDITGKLMNAQKFESGSTHLSSLDYTISNIKSKVQGTTYGIALQFLENELADFEWKFNRRKQTKKQIFKPLGKTLVKGAHRTRVAMIDYFNSIKESMTHQWLTEVSSLSSFIIIN